MLTHPYIFYQIKTVLLTGHYVLPLVLLISPMLTVWDYTIQWSSGKVPVLLAGHYVMSVVTWSSSASATDLRDRFLLSGVFYLARISAFLRLIWSWQFNLKISRASCWSSNHSRGLTICLNHRNPQNIYTWYLLFIGQDLPVTEY